MPNDDEFEVLLGTADFETLTNKDGFNALPTGVRFDDGHFYYYRDYTNFWSATAYSMLTSYSLALDYDGGYAYLEKHPKTIASPVRLIKG